MKKVIIFIVVFNFIGGIFAANLYAKKKEKGLALQCQVLVSASNGDFTSIQDALDYLNPNPEIPCTVLVAAGIYIESIQIEKNHINLKGSGADRTTLKPSPDSPAIILNGVNNIKISGFNISDSNFEGIKSLNSSLLDIASNQFVDNDVAIYLAGGENVTIDKNVFDQNEGRDLGSILIVSSQQVSITDNIFIGGEAIVTDIENAYGKIITATIAGNSFTGVDPAIENNANRPGCWTKIIGNIINGNGLADKGIRNDGPAVISKNLIENCRLFAILNNADQTVISNNLLRKNENYSGSVISTSGTSTITGNIIMDNDGYGISFFEGLTTVTGNTLKNNGRYGVYALGTGVVMGNAFIDNLEGCIKYVSSSTVAAANLCENTLAISGDIVSEDDLNIHVGGNMNIVTGLNLSIGIGTDLNINTGQDISIGASGDIITSGANHSVTSSADTIINSGSDSIINSDHNTKLDTVNNTLITSGGTVTIKGSKIIQN